MMFRLILADLAGRLAIRDGKIENSPYNLALLARIDTVFDAFTREVLRSVLPEFTQGLFAVMALTGELYTGMQAQRNTYRIYPSRQRNGRSVPVNMCSTMQSHGYSLLGAHAS